MLFDYLKNILHKKQPDILEEDNDFVPFLIQRWLTMYSPEMAYVINETTNKYWVAYRNKQEWYDAFISMTPKVSFRKLNYIKKGKEQNSKEEDMIKAIARNMEISQREVKLYLEKVEVDKKAFGVDIYKK